MNLTLEKILDWIAWIVMTASASRIALHWFRDLLKLWVSPTSQFWDFYDKLELTVAYIAGSLAVFGKKSILSTPEAPITKAQSPAEGRIIK